MKFVLLLLSFIASSLCSTDTSTILSQDQALTLVNKYKSILLVQNYYGHTYNQTALDILAANYTLISDSSLSVRGAALNASGALFTSRSQYLTFLSSRLANGTSPFANVSTISASPVIDAGSGTGAVLWYWVIQPFGKGAGRVKGSNLLHLDGEGKVYLDELEFNSVAWLVGDGNLETLYCE